MRFTLILNFAYLAMRKFFSCSFGNSSTSTLSTKVSSATIVYSRRLVDSGCGLRRFLNDIYLLFVCLDCDWGHLLPFILPDHQVVCLWTRLQLHLSLHHATWYYIFSIACNMRGEHLDSDSFSCHLRSFCFDTLQLLLSYIFTVHNSIFA